ncbi:MAG: TIM barrel protein [Spirochaetales bacterium]|nr:TIM barrel protein [Spirochaetales bacterium]
MKYQGILSINSIMRPNFSVTDFIRLSAGIGLSAVELRNDLPDPRIYGGESAEVINSVSAETGVRILTINALQRFNDPFLFNKKKNELEELVSTAAGIKCPMIVLCPVNDPEDSRSDEEQHKDLSAALVEYAPVLEKNGITGLIEPLGFSICSLRTKAQAVKAIQETNLSSVFKITHDTFHHYLSGETEVFPDETGLIHVSGVLPDKEKGTITDDDRILVTPEDCMRNREQVKSLINGGYTGPVSYEAFSPEVQKMGTQQLAEGIKASIQLLFS